MSPTPELSRIRQALREALPELPRSDGMESLAVFGSVTRDAAGLASDIGILFHVEAEPPGLFGFVRLEHHLSEILGRPVDLVMETVLKPCLPTKKFGGSSLGMRGAVG